MRGPRSSTTLTSFAIALPIAIADSIRLKTKIFFIVVKIKGLYFVIFLDTKVQPKAMIRSRHVGKTDKPQREATIMLGEQTAATA